MYHSYGQKLPIEKLTVPKTYVSHQVRRPICVDGEIEAEWNKAEISDAFVDIEGEKIPQYQTQFKMLWDKQNIYVLAILQEPHIWGNLKQRDTIIFYNNDFELFIDPDGDTHNYMEIEVNALNTVWDLFLNKPYRNNAIVENDWNIKGINTAVSYNGSLNNPNDRDVSWILEMAIPWEGLNKGNPNNKVPVNTFWRINFSRVNWDFDLVNNSYSRKKGNDGHYLDEYNWVWSPQGVINMHEPEHWGYVFFASFDSKIRTIKPPKDALFVQWMYNHYTNHINAQKPPVGKRFFDSKLIKLIPVKIDGFLCWEAKNPWNNKTYRILNDGKLLIL